MWDDRAMKDGGSVIESGQRKGGRIENKSSGGPSKQPDLVRKGDTGKEDGLNKGRCELTNRIDLSETGERGGTCTGRARYACWVEQEFVRRPIRPVLSGKEVFSVRQGQEKGGVNDIEY